MTAPNRDKCPWGWVTLEAPDRWILDQPEAERPSVTFILNCHRWRKKTLALTKALNRKKRYFELQVCYFGNKFFLIWILPCGGYHKGHVYIMMLIILQTNARQVCYIRVKHRTHWHLWIHTCTRYLLNFYFTLNAKYEMLCGEPYVVTRRCWISMFFFFLHGLRPLSVKLLWNFLIYVTFPRRCRW